MIQAKYRFLFGLIGNGKIQNIMTLFKTELQLSLVNGPDLLMGINQSIGPSGYRITFCTSCCVPPYAMHRELCVFKRYHDATATTSLT